MWNGNSACIGVVEDVSSTGIRVSQLPSHFDQHSRKCFIIVHGPLQDFKLTLQAKWRSETQKEMHQMIGFKIVNPTLNWKNFIEENLADSRVQDSLPSYQSRPIFKRRINNEGQDPYSIALFLAAMLSNKTFAQGKGGNGKKSSAGESNSGVSDFNNQKMEKV
jgi:hypothetical protein